MGNCPGGSYLVRNCPGELPGDKLSRWELSGGCCPDSVLHYLSVRISNKNYQDNAPFMYINQWTLFCTCMYLSKGYVMYNSSKGKNKNEEFECINRYTPISKFLK